MSTQDRGVRADGQVDTDRPVSSPSEDILGRAAFARTLAGTLARVSGSDPLVVGLYGPWGSGKTLCAQHGSALP